MEAEQAQARKEAQEREARLQAEKEALSNSVGATGGEKTGDLWLKSPWASPATTFLGQPPSCTPPTDGAASSVNGAAGSVSGAATDEGAAAAVDADGAGERGAVSPKKEATGGPGSPMVSTRASSKSPQKEQQQDGKDGGATMRNAAADAGAADAAGSIKMDESASPTSLSTATASNGPSGSDATHSPVKSNGAVTRGSSNTTVAAGTRAVNGVQKL